MEERDEGVAVDLKFPMMQQESVVKRHKHLGFLLFDFCPFSK